MYEPPAAIARELDAELMRESAYFSAVEQLKKGRITQPEAVAALRYAYRRAECHLRSMPLEEHAA